MLKRSNDYVRYDPQTTGPSSTLEFSQVSRPGGSATDMRAIAFNLDGTINTVVQVANGNSVPFNSATIDKVVIVYTNSSATNYTGSNTFDVRVTVVS